MCSTCGNAPPRRPAVGIGWRMPKRCPRRPAFRSRLFHLRGVLTQTRTGPQPENGPGSPARAARSAREMDAGGLHRTLFKTIGTSMAATGRHRSPACGERAQDERSSFASHASSVACETRHCRFAIVRPEPWLQVFKYDLRSGTEGVRRPVAAGPIRLEQDLSAVGQFNRPGGGRRHDGVPSEYLEVIITRQ